jgi:arabinose-5-phosphate isomerase
MDATMTLQVIPKSNRTRLDHARSVLETEALALQEVASRLDETFDRVIERFLKFPGRIAVTGIGKSADIAQKIVGTFNSTGTRAYFLDATKALHGDLGMIHPDDVALVLSHSGESEELVRLLGPLRTLSAAVIGITGNRNGTLARLANDAIVYGPIIESCPLALAPSASATVMMAIGHALAFVLSEERQFSREDFAKFHPAGSLGRKLANVEAYMRRNHELRIAKDTDSVRTVFAQAHQRGRRTGAIMLVDDQGRLSGIFTDSDLARIFEKRSDEALDKPISDVMTKAPITIRHHAKMNEAVDIFRYKKISELPVLDENHCPVGLLDITDVIGLLPAEEENQRFFDRKSA